MNTRLQQKKKDRSAGFTLVELMVSLTLFTIVVLAAVSSLYTVNSASRKVQAMRTVMDNLNFAVESMSRTIRTGSDFICGGQGNIASPNCSFINQVGSDRLLVNATLGLDAGETQIVEYRLDTHPNGNGALQKQVWSSGIPGGWIAMTTPEIDIDQLSFYVDGVGTADTKQPGVQMVIRGVVTTTADISPFIIQTYVSQRAGE